MSYRPLLGQMVSLVLADGSCLCFPLGCTCHGLSVVWCGAFQMMCMLELPTELHWDATTSTDARSPFPSERLGAIRGPGVSVMDCGGTKYPSARVSFLRSLAA